MCLWPSQTIKRSSSVVKIIIQMSLRRMLYDRSLETGGLEGFLKPVAKKYFNLLQSIDRHKEEVLT